MPSPRNRLQFKMPFFNGSADGPFAILALVAIAALFLLLK